MYAFHSNNIFPSPSTLFSFFLFITAFYAFPSLFQHLLFAARWQRALLVLQT
uniref:Uncharacterized protein n=1 Tax=Meloidogyne enterolobii TaxID=390850 RepID=A0A6V7UIC9_MELEN|nr:unnamed protein product [Meloidogyne enterolobii]